MKIQFNTQSSISNEHYEHIGKSHFVDNYETGIRDDNQIATKSSKENPLSTIKTLKYEIDIPNTRIKDDKNIAHQTSKENPFSVIEERVILPEKLTVCYKKEKVLQHPTSTQLCNSASTWEVN